MTKLADHTPATLAEAWGSDPRSIRKFLRANGTKVGKGARHAIPADARSMKSLRKQYDAWVATRTPATEGSDEGSSEGSE